MISEQLLHKNLTKAVNDMGYFISFPVGEFEIKLKEVNSNIFTVDRIYNFEKDYYVPMKFEVYPKANPIDAVEDIINAIYKLNEDSMAGDIAGYTTIAGTKKRKKSKNLIMRNWTY